MHVLAIIILSIRPSVRLSWCHVPVLNQAATRISRVNCTEQSSPIVRVKFLVHPISHITTNKYTYMIIMRVTVM